MTNWKEYKLGDLVTFQRGHDLPRTEMKDGIYPVAGSNSIIGFHNKFTTKSPGITIGRSGNIGNPQLHKSDFWAHNTTLYVKEFKKVDPVFFYYLLTTLDFTQLNSGSAVPSLNRNFIHPFIVSIPDNLSTQIAIAEILSSLDDKIELNNKINQELENLAQTLFKQWFIDFEFPANLADSSMSEAEGYKSSGGEMVESELGMIPKGWEVSKISELNPKLETGRRPKGGVKGIDSGIPSVGAESIKGVGYFDFSKTKYVSSEFASKMKRGIVNGYELLLYKDGGKPGTFLPHFGMYGEGFPFDNFVINEHVFLLDFFDKKFNCFAYYYFDSLLVRPILEYSGGKAAIPGINQGDVNNLFIYHPNNKLVQSFSEIAYSSISTILINSKENTYLTNLRDTLLPKLISGELEVSDAHSTIKN